MVPSTEFVNKKSNHAFRYLVRSINRRLASMASAVDGERNPATEQPPEDGETEKAGRGRHEFCIRFRMFFAVAVTVVGSE